MEKKLSVMAWLLAACLSVGLLPDLVITICSARTEGTFPAVLSLGVGLAAVCIGLLFFARAVYVRFGKGDKLFCVLGFFPCLLLYLIVLYGGDALLPVLSAVYGARGGLLAGIFGILAVLWLVLMGIFFLAWLNGCRKMPMEHPVCRFFVKIYFGIPMSVLLWAAVLAIPFLQVLLRLLWKEPGVLSRHLALIAGALMMAGFLNGAMALAEKMMDGSKKRMAGAEKAAAGEPATAGAARAAADKETTATGVAKKTAAAGIAGAGAGVRPAASDGRESLAAKGRGPGRRYAPQLAALVICMVLVLSRNMMQLTGNEAAMLNAQLKDSLIEYGFYLAASDIGRAAGIAKEAAERMDSALLAAEDAEKEADGDTSALKRAEKKTKALKKVCDRYEIFQKDGRALAFLEQYKKYGGADAALVEEALALSEEYQDSLWVQYTAALLGSSLTYDKATHYDRTAEAILRCEALYRKEKGTDGAGWLPFEKSMAQMLFKVYHEEEAAELLMKLADASGDGDTELYELLVRCYDRMESLNEAYELAVSYCENREDSPYLMYYAALSALKLDKTAECLTYTSGLAAYTAGCDGDELNDCDTWLFGMLEYLSLDDNRSYTDFQYDVYTELTEEENAVIDENPFFRNYLDAVYLAYHPGRTDRSEEAFERMEAVLSENPKLASAWYLCGIIASNTGAQEEKEDAIWFYRRAGELNDEIPAVWYAMAREYDRLGEYEKGIAACKRALALLPEQDHGTDWYGISYHCSNLLSSLQMAVK